MMKLGSTYPNSDMGVVWGLLCLHPNTIKPSYYITPIGWCIAILRFFFTIIIIIIILIILIITSPWLLSGDVLLFYVSFSLLLLRHPERSRLTYCYSTFLFHYYYYYYSYSYSSTHLCPHDFSEMPWSNFMKPCRNIICHVKLCS
jgi:hypothetical protein